MPVPAGDPNPKGFTNLPSASLQSASPLSFQAWEHYATQPDHSVPDWSSAPVAFTSTRLRLSVTPASVASIIVAPTATQTWYAANEVTVLTTGSLVQDAVIHDTSQTQLDATHLQVQSTIQLKLNGTGGATVTLDMLGTQATAPPPSFTSRPVSQGLTVT